MLKYLLYILLFISALHTDAQTNKYFDDIKNTFDKNGQKELNNISNALKTAQKNFDEGEILFSSGEISRALAESKKASEIFKNNYRNLYMLYVNKLTSVINETEGIQKTYFQKKMRDAKNYYRVAIYNRLKGGEEKEKNTVFDLLKTAHKNEILAMDVLSRMFAVINAWEKTDYVVEENNYKLEEAFLNTNTNGFNTRSFSVNDSYLESSFTFNHQLVANNDNLTVNSNYNNNYQSNTIVYNMPGHDFRIQIGASILPANEMQLKRLNKTNKSVNTYKSRIYYKYTVGRFSEFQEAKNFKNAYGLSNVYIVEYNKGKEVKFYMKDYQ